MSLATGGLAGVAEQLEGRDRPGDQARGKEGGAGGRSRKRGEAGRNGA